LATCNANCQFAAQANSLRYEIRTLPNDYLGEEFHDSTRVTRNDPKQRALILPIDSGAPTEGRPYRCRTIDEKL